MIHEYHELGKQMQCCHIVGGGDPKYQLQHYKHETGHRTPGQTKHLKLSG